MYISMNWIKDFVDLDGISTEELVKRFNLATAEIEGYEEKGKDTYGVVFGKIIECKNHPESNHLHILKVDVGKEVLQIVCGAPNAREGLVTCVATVGGCVSGMKIKPAKLVGVESFGMCCSAAELGIGADDDGIMEVTENVTLGEDIKNVWPVDDVVLEIDNKTLTNRPDLWGHYGLAREFAAIFDKQLKPLETLDLSKFDGLEKIPVENLNEDCYRYGAISVDNVTVKKSPMKMAIRLCYAGMRDINLLADITNYVMLETGQPMHAFDHDVVSGIKVLKAQKGDKLLTLEGEEHDIPEGAIVIADDKKVPVAIAGIKGGLKSSISDTTTNVLFEGANFDPVMIRKTSRAIGLVTDASQRYEKSLDPELTSVALGRLLEILRHIDKDIVVSSAFSDVYTKKYDKKIINITSEFISRRIGAQISDEQIVKVLSALGFGVEQNGEVITAHVPTYRATKDVSMKEDLVEEIARMYGYDNIVPSPLSFNPSPVELNVQVREEYEVKKLLAVKYNAVEVQSHIWNFADFNKAHFIESESIVKLLDSSNAGQSGIRSELLPTMLKVVSENRNVLSDIRVFEVGRVAPSLNEEKLVNEEKHLAVVFASQTESIENLFEELKRFVIDYAKNELQLDLWLKEGEKPSYMHPYNTFRIVSREDDFGYVGVLNPKVSKSIDKRLNMVCLELDFGVLAGKHGFFKKAKVPSKFQSVKLDVSVSVPASMLYGELEQVLNKYRSKISNGYILKDIYEADSQTTGTKNVTVSYELCGKDHTLEGTEIDQFLNGLIEHLEKNKLVVKR